MDSHTTTQNMRATTCFPHWRSTSISHVQQEFKGFRKRLPRHKQQFLRASLLCRANQLWNQRWVGGWVGVDICCVVATKALVASMIELWLLQLHTSTSQTRSWCTFSDSTQNSSSGGHGVLKTSSLWSAVWNEQLGCNPTHFLSEG